jgi:hypothetical protein
MASLFDLKCATAGFASLGKTGLEGLKKECSKLDGIFILGICIVLTLIFWFLKLSNWAKVAPAIFGSIYTLGYLPYRFQMDLANEAAFAVSGLSKSEWISGMGADSRTRLSVVASLTAAIIVSLNAWLRK